MAWCSTMAAMPGLPIMAAPNSPSAQAPSARRRTSRSDSAATNNRFIASGESPSRAAKARSSAGASCSTSNNFSRTQAASTCE
jgi:hypothetical protein